MATNRVLIRGDGIETSRAKNIGKPGFKSFTTILAGFREKHRGQGILERAEKLREASFHELLDNRHFLEFLVPAG